MTSDERHQFIDIANEIMIKASTFVLKLATAILSMGVVCGADGTGQPQATGSVQLTGSDNGFCQFVGVKNGCDANYVLQSTLYDDGSVVGVRSLMSAKCLAMKPFWSRPTWIV